MTCSVDVVYNGSGLHAGRGALTRFTRDVLTCVLEDLNLPGASVSVLYCSDDVMQRLNRDYREINSATDVLSFPSSEKPAEFLGQPEPDLGDLAIALRYTAANNVKGTGRRGRRALADEVALLLVHGVLHLLGWDHDAKAAEKRMWREQDGLLEKTHSIPRPELKLV